MPHARGEVPWKTEDKAAKRIQHSHRSKSSTGVRFDSVNLRENAAVAAAANWQRIDEPKTRRWDGKISVADAAIQISPALLKLLRRMFEAMDADGNGEISKGEAVAFWGSNFAKVSAASMFSSVDADDNEQISWDEFLVYWSNVVAAGYPEAEIHCELSAMLEEPAPWTAFGVVPERRGKYTLPGGRAAFAPGWDALPPDAQAQIDDEDDEAELRAELAADMAAEERRLRCSPAAAASSNAFDSKLFKPGPPEWISGVTAKQAFGRRPTGAEQQRLLDPRSRRTLATDWHGRQLNDHVYTGPLDAAHAVFAYRPLTRGPMASFLAHPIASPAKDDPRGRTRSMRDFFED